MRARDYESLPVTQQPPSPLVLSSFSLSFSVYILPLIFYFFCLSKLIYKAIIGSIQQLIIEWVSHALIRAKFL